MRTFVQWCFPLISISVGFGALPEDARKFANVVAESLGEAYSVNGPFDVTTGDDHLLHYDIIPRDFSDDASRRQHYFSLIVGRRLSQEEFAENLRFNRLTMDQVRTITDAKKLEAALWAMRWEPDGFWGEVSARIEVCTNGRPFDEKEHEKVNQQFRQIMSLLSEYDRAQPGATDNPDSAGFQAERSSSN